MATWPRVAVLSFRRQGLDCAVPRRGSLSAVTSIFRRAGRPGWTLKYEDATGRDRFRTFRTRALAEDEALRLRQQPDSGKIITFAEYAETWLKRTRAHVRPGTARIYGWAIDKHLVPAFGKLQLSEMKSAAVKDLLASLLETLGRKTVANVRSTLYTCLEEARDDGLIFLNPAAIHTRGRALRLRPSRAERAAKVKAFDAAQLALLLEAPSRYPLLFRLLAFTGMRIGEALALQWEDVDLVGRQITIHRSWTGGKIQPTKTGIERDVDVASGLAETLRAYDVETKAAALQAGEARAPWLWPGSKGNPIDPRLAQQDFKRMLTKAGLRSHYTPHSLRHTFATLLLTRGVSIYYVQRQLGHATIGMTVDLYGSWLPAGDVAVVDGLEAAIRQHVTANVTNEAARDAPGAERRR